MKLSELKNDEYLYLEEYEKTVTVEEFKDEYSDYKGTINTLKEEKIELDVDILIEDAIENLDNWYGYEGWVEEAELKISAKTKKLFKKAIDSLIEDLPNTYRITDEEVEVDL